MEEDIAKYTFFQSMLISHDGSQTRFFSVLGVYPESAEIPQTNQDMIVIALDKKKCKSPENSAYRRLKSCRVGENAGLSRMGLKRDNLRVFAQKTLYSTYMYCLLENTTENKLSKYL
ncbi:hypothetical protein TNCV_1052031 [Trichonephila clavipes]|nr:hypothetical protein TNCV_1052031 [Trichonephila clavipes]